MTRTLLLPGFLGLLGVLVLVIAVLMIATPGQLDARVLPLKADPPLTLPGKAARFDYMATDAKNDRILAAHKGAAALTILDLKTGKPLTEVPVGHIQGIAVDEKANVYIAGAEDEHRVVIVDAQSFLEKGTVALPGPVDALALDPRNGLVYADEDHGSHVWVVDPQAQKLVATIAIPGDPEALAYDAGTNRIYQNIKDRNLVAILNPDTNQVEATVSTLPATGPHGIAIDPAKGRALIAGHNGKAVALDLRSRKVTGDVDIALGTDQIAFDEATHTLFCASNGLISVVTAAKPEIRLIADVPAHAGAHTLAVDPTRHELWISYADRNHSYLQKFEATRK